MMINKRAIPHFLYVERLERALARRDGAELERLEDFAIDDDGVYLLDKSVPQKFIPVPRWAARAA